MLTSCYSGARTGISLVRVRDQGEKDRQTLVARTSSPQMWLIFAIQACPLILLLYCSALRLNASSRAKARWGEEISPVLEAPRAHHLKYSQSVVRVIWKF